MQDTRINNAVFNPLFHPYLFMIAFVLYFYSRAQVTISPDQILRPILFFSILIFILSRIGGWLLPDRAQIGLYLTIFVLGLCSTLNFFTFVILIAVAVLGLWFLYSKVRRRGIKLTQISLLLNFIGLVMVVAFAPPPITAFRVYSELIDRRKNTELTNLEPTPEALPDIYLIILDGYVRSDVLQELFGYDNSDFVDSLKERGFIIPSKSRSNYPKTALSVPSVLNMNYTHTLILNSSDSYYWWLVAPFVDRSRVRVDLEQLGYKSISVMTDWSITDNPTTDIYYHPKPLVLNGFENALLSATPFGTMIAPLLSNVAFVHSNQGHHELSLYQFSTLVNLPALPGPKFVFAHIISPHPPFVTDENGDFQQPGYSFTFNDASDFPFSDEAYRDGYVGQVKFVNAQVDALVESILENSETPPIIILQADHGSGLMTDFQSSAATCLEERFSVFAAYYLPGMSDKDVPDDITPVNLFRVVFNHYFKADLPLLERAHYYPTSALQLYREEDVTSRVDTCTTP